MRRSPPAQQVRRWRSLSSYYMYLESITYYAAADWFPKSTAERIGLNVEFENQR